MFAKLKVPPEKAAAVVPAEPEAAAVVPAGDAPVPGRRRPEIVVDRRAAAIAARLARAAGA